MSRKVIEKKRIIIIGVFLSLFLIGTILIFATPTSIKITYGLSAKSKDDNMVSFNVFEPVDGDKEKKAVIIGHGVMVNKEMLKGYAIELAAAGFVAVPFDFRGHGQSTGALNFGDLINDIKAIKGYLEDRGDIDVENGLGYIGYSMGGFPAAELVKKDESFKCFIGIGTGLPLDEDDAVKIDSGHELNVLMILAQYDQAFSFEKIKEGMGIRMDIDADDIDVNKLYGSFSDGTASKIFLDDNSDHLTTAWDQDFIREARDWVMNTFPDVRAVDQYFYVNVRALIFLLQIIGGIGLFFLLIEPLSNLIIKDRVQEPYKIELEGETAKSISKSFIIYSFILSWLFLFMAVIFLMLPLLLAGLMLALLLGQIFGILLLLRKYAKKTNSSLKTILTGPFKVSREKLQRELILGIILAVLLYFILYISIGLNYLGMIPSISKIIWIPIYFAVLFFIFLVFNIAFESILHQKFEDGFKGMFKSVGAAFGILAMYLTTWILVPCILLGNYFLTLVLMISIPIYLLTVFVSAVVYQKTGSVVVSAIANTFFLICLLSTLSPFLNIFIVLEQMGDLSSLAESVF